MPVGSSRVWLCGTAGAGSSTALASLVANCSGPCVSHWCALGGGDDQIDLALQSLSRRIGQLTGQGHSRGRNGLGRAVRRWAQQHTAESLTVAIDSVQLLGAAAVEMLGALQLPPGVKLVCCGCGSPPPGWHPLQLPADGTLLADQIASQLQGAEEGMEEGRDGLWWALQLLEQLEQQWPPRQVALALSCVAAAVSGLSSAQLTPLTGLSEEQCEQLLEGCGPLLVKLGSVWAPAGTTIRRAISGRYWAGCTSSAPAAAARELVRADWRPAQLPGVCTALVLEQTIDGTDG